MSSNKLIQALKEAGCKCISTPIKMRKCRDVEIFLKKLHAAEKRARYSKMEFKLSV